MNPCLMTRHPVCTPHGMFQPSVSTPLESPYSSFSSGYGDASSGAFVDATSSFDFEQEASINWLLRRWRRERRRRKVGRAFDMALEISRSLRKTSSVSRILDVGCGNGYIAHHLSAILGVRVVGIDLDEATEAPIDYRPYEGTAFPIETQSLDAVLFCYVLHHAQDLDALLREVRRVLRAGGQITVYEDMPESWWDRILCGIHDRTWRSRTGPCTFRTYDGWRRLFQAAGFEVVTTRALSRWRNLAHPVSRRFFLLRRENDEVSASHQ